VQEVAFTLANGISYVEAAVKAGLDVDDFAPRVSFFFNTHLDFLEEVAKFRAARRLWAKIMKERFKAQNPRSWMLRFHTQTGRLYPHRPAAPTITSSGGLSGHGRGPGGNPIPASNSYDEALALPTEQIGAPRPPDPADHRP
jgi:methylmalonyl-CoA mutase, N-terminal domain